MIIDKIILTLSLSSKMFILTYMLEIHGFEKPSSMHAYVFVRSIDLLQHLSLIMV